MLLNKPKSHHSPIRTSVQDTSTTRARRWLMADTKRPFIVGAAFLAVVWGGVGIALLNGGGDAPSPAATAAPNDAQSPTEATGTPEQVAPTTIPNMALKPSGSGAAPVPYPTDPFGISASPTTAPQGTKDDGPSTGDDAAAAAVAKRFVTAWTGAATAKDQNAWINSLRPVTSSRLLSLLRMTDLRTVPRSTVTGSTASAEMGIMAAKVTLANATAMRITFTREAGGAWLVDGYEQV